MEHLFFFFSASPFLSACLKKCLKYSVYNVGGRQFVYGRVDNLSMGGRQFVYGRVDNLSMVG